MMHLVEAGVERSTKARACISGRRLLRKETDLGSHEVRQMSGRVPRDTWRPGGVCRPRGAACPPEHCPV